MNKPNGRSLSRIKYMLTGLSVFTVGFLITLGARFYLSLVQIPQTSAFGVANIAVEVVLKLSLALVPVLSAVLFGMSHIPINTYIYHPSTATMLYNLAGASIFGVVAGYLFFITGNILTSISLHSAWNVTQFALPPANRYSV